MSHLGAGILHYSYTSEQMLQAYAYVANESTPRACLNGGGGPQVGEVTNLIPST